MKKASLTAAALVKKKWKVPHSTEAEAKARKGGNKEDHLTQGQNWDKTNMPTVARKATGKMSAPNCQMIPNWAPSRGEEARWSGANITWPSSHMGPQKMIL